jgi:superfamily I DNA and/or RNA helicase
VVAEARVVLATMTNVYMSALMDEQRFDAVIVEEAGMAVLPTLFYCASLGKQRAIMVGDPQQLPSIVQSSEPVVRRAMGRSIFQVTVTEPHLSDLVVMLDTQYRMHPRIGDLVGGLFYDGRLRHGEITQQTERIAARAPCPGSAIVVVDTAGASTCGTPSGSYFRYNDAHAAIAVDMARQAVEAGDGSVAVIAPYVEQLRRIGRLLSGNRSLSERVECRTVHRFQGGERDVVIFDTVDAEPLAPGRLLSDTTPSSSASNLINVSLSRARGKLVILADVAYFRRHHPTGVISRVLAAAQESGAVVAG